MVTHNSVNFYHSFSKFKEILQKFLNMNYELRQTRKKNQQNKKEKKNRKHHQQEGNSSMWSRAPSQREGNHRTSLLTMGIH